MRPDETRNTHIAGDEVSYIVPAVLCSFFAITAFVFGFIYLIPSISKKKSMEETMGTIVYVHSCGRSGENGPNTGGETWSASVEYEVEGSVFEMLDKHCFGKPPTIGNSFPVLYNPNDPWESESGTFFALWLLPTILYIFATILLSLGFILTKRLRSKRSR